MDKVRVQLTGPNIRGGPITGVLRVGDSFILDIDAENCESPPETIHYNYAFEVLEIIKDELS